MIYKAVEVIWIFSADGTGRAGRAGIEGTIRGPRGPKKKILAQASVNTMTPVPDSLSSLIP